VPPLGPLSARRSDWTPAGETIDRYCPIMLLRHLTKARGTLALMLERRSWRAATDGAGRPVDATGRLLTQGGTKPPVLLTPALVDLRRWVSGSDGELGIWANWFEQHVLGYVVGIGESITRTTVRSMTLAEQMEVMRLLAERRPEGLLVHPFVPYDPWSGALDLQAGKADTMLSFVRTAVEVQGAVGVKLYPPMGFRASGNARLSTRQAEFDPPDRPAFRRELEDALGAAETGGWIDRALEGLYRWCQAEGVPILAHTGPSHAGNSEARYYCRAFPGYWEPVFRRYPGIRVNLGHFGGLWTVPLNLRDGPPTFPGAPAVEGCGFRDPVGPTRDPQEKDPRRWPAEVGRLIRCYPDNVFADFADVPMPREVPEDERDYAERYDTLVRNFYNDPETPPPGVPGVARSPTDPIWRNVMYASDFPFTMNEPSALDYRANLERRLALPRSASGFGLSAERVEGVMYGNAARFLGLVKGAPAGSPAGKTLARLRDFHLRAIHADGGQGDNDRAEAIIDAIFRPFLVPWVAPQGPRCPPPRLA
jgi:predicted TIM-barrel fold metal-dependent hydrolase